ncbi:MAG: hypothetical protein AC479_07190 [miscellaneous Crenarchaeota group-6 archaeon AD8-1]|nr:MAG: hypothetical protein AC479_07190 [miscellaneous Crenarchaeota group-6 archaeon AD8-1]
MIPPLVVSSNPALGTPLSFGKELGLRNMELLFWFIWFFCGSKYSKIEYRSCSEILERFKRFF